MSNGEKINLQFSDAIVENCELHYTYGDNDAIDYDGISNGIIRNNILHGGEDDGLDIGQINAIACNNVILQNTCLRRKISEDVTLYFSVTKTTLKRKF